jgi:hypothetical protein
MRGRRDRCCVERESLEGWILSHKKVQEWSYESKAGRDGDGMVAK